MQKINVSPGLEVAAFVHDKASSVSVVGTSRLPLQHIFGEQIGFIFKQVAITAEHFVFASFIFISILFSL